MSAQENEENTEAVNVPIDVASGTVEGSRPELNENVEVEKKEDQYDEPPILEEDAAAEYATFE
jgi:hypothetical protein